MIMGILSFISPMYYILANIFLAPFLSTIDRLLGGFGIKFSIIKLVFLVFGFLLLLVPRGISLKKKSLSLLILIGLLTGLDIFASLKRGDLAQWVNQDLIFMGIPYMAFAFIIPFFNISAAQTVKTLEIVIKYLMVPAALFGIFQYIVGPEGVEKLGFTLVTPNTENTYSDFFVHSAQRFTDSGLRPFSFFSSSADLGAMMFHGVLWTTILFLHKGKYNLSSIIIILTVFSGLLFAQFISTICLAVLALFYLFYEFSKKTGSIKKFLFFLCFFCLIIVLILAISQPLRYRVLGSFQLVSNFGNTTSLASRLAFLSNFKGIIETAPLQGIGLGNHSLLLGMFTADWWILYMSLMLGIPIALCLFVIFLYIFLQAKKKMKYFTFMSDEWKILQITSLTFLAIMLGAFSNGHIICTAPSNYIVWFLAGSVFSTWKRKIPFPTAIPLLDNRLKEKKDD